MIVELAGEALRAMVAVVWITESSWEACIEQARRMVGDAAEVRLVHVSPSDVEDLVDEGLEGLLGRRPTPPPQRAVRTIAAEEAQALLAKARTRFARSASVHAVRGRPERELLRLCADADLLVLARDREPRLGPKSLSHEARFIVDHSPCAVLLIWPQRPARAREAREP